MKKYCENCQKETQVKYETLKNVFNVKGESIEAEITICKCLDCGEEIFDEELEIANEKIVFGLYREKKDLLQPEEIKKIRESYGLSQASFAKLLGFGEKTITRYENGSIQDVAHDILIRFVANVDEFLDLWERRNYVLTEKENQNIKQNIIMAKTMSIAKIIMAQNQDNKNWQKSLNQSACNTVFYSNNDVSYRGKKELCLV